MRVVADTNTIISGVLWSGNPRRVLDAARDGLITLYTSPSLLKELEEVLERDKFAARLSAANLTAKVLARNFASVAIVVEPDPIEPVILRDPDDDFVIACAVFVDCDVIVSGDNDLIDIKEYRGVRILTAAELLAELQL